MADSSKNLDPSLSKKIEDKKPGHKEVKKSKKNEDIVIGYVSEFFPEEIIQRIRYLHFKIKHIEESLTKIDHDISPEELYYILEYVKILNLNYKFKSQNLILRELGITSTYLEPIDNKQIIIHDIMFECARVLWILARAYEELSKKYEDEEKWENSIIAMVNCSKSYKTAAYFSIAAVNQDDIGSSLISENLELKSEEARILAQSLVALKEELQNNYYFASKLYVGLSTLSKRLLYLKDHDTKKKNHLTAQIYYDIGKACHLKALVLLSKRRSDFKGKEKEDRVKTLQRKANYYFSQSEAIWEDMVNKFEDLTKKEKEQLKENLSIINECIMENDVEIGNVEDIMEIQDPKPIIAVPENMAFMMPKTVLYLTKFTPIDVNVKLFKKYKKKKLTTRPIDDKRAELSSKKAGIGRIIKELKILFDNNDIDIDKFIELMEKYSSKMGTIEQAIEELNKSKNDN
jgi:hypothetical protein